MKNTVGAILLVGVVISSTFVIALVAVAKVQTGSSGAYSDVQADYIYDYPTSLWADH